MSVIRPRTPRRHPVALLASAGLAAAVITAGAGTATAGTAGTADRTADRTATGTSTSAAATAAPAEYRDGTYLVQLSELPVVSYDGRTAGYQATKAGKGQKVDPNAAEVKRYAAHLDSAHDAALAKVNGNGKARKLYDYRYSYNGFAAELTGAQAQKLAADGSVVSVVPDERRTLDTSRTPEFLGLSTPGGAWSKLGGAGTGGAGEGVIIGIVDSGIWPESLSFTDRNGTNASGKDGKLGPHQIPGWHGKCTPGEAFTAADCNQKLIGAQYFVDGFGADELLPEEYLSARDGDGHGSHTASTAGGNTGVPAVVDGADLGKVSGMAPNARIAAYKVCWNGDAGGCNTSDSVAAIDQAVADGVDVINYSISGSTRSFVDPVEIAFLFAADAGVFVAASAGNSGPTASTAAHNSPWLTSVAAGTHDRDGLGSVTLGNGTTYNGKSITGGTGATPLPLVNAVDVVKADAVFEPGTSARLCVPGTLDPAKTTGKIVVCDRGVIGRTDKSLAVRDAGGKGMVLVNPSANSVNADLHYVPTVHLDVDAYKPVKDYAATAGATAVIAPGTLVFGVEAPQVATFSSRGPALAGGGDVLKPDIEAPGVDVLAAVAPPSNHGRSFDFLSGTSMSSPHIAGIGALMKQAHPDWSPMMIKSALMTTAAQTTNKGNPLSGNPFGYGAGHVAATSALDPGLVYDSRWTDWLRFLCGTGSLSATGGTCTSVGSVDPSDLNQASIAVGELAGDQTVTRTVTNVGGKSATYTASVAAPAGVAVTVTPSTLTLAPGASASYTARIVRTTAKLGTYAFGSLTWSDGAHKVRSPIAVKPVALSAPAVVTGNGASGSAAIPVRPGYTGTLSSRVFGLVKSTVDTATLSGADGSQFPSTAPAPSAHTARIDVTVPGSAGLVRFATFDADYPAGTDLDLFVYRVNSDGSLTAAGSSAGGTAEEQVDVNRVPSSTGSTYAVFVDAYAIPGGGSLTAKLNSWALSAVDAGNLTVSPNPASVTQGQPTSLTAAWTGLTDGRWLGRIQYSDGTTTVGASVVRVDVP